MIRKSKGYILSILLLGMILGMTGCNSSLYSQSGFNLIFRYGVGARNELNTFQGTYTKDMISDPPITVDLSLTEEELDRIYQKMLETGLFSYPEEFSITLASGELMEMVTPHSSYFLKVEYGSVVKELRWEDKLTNQNEEAEKLRELFKLIRDIIEAKDEYKQLPEPTGGYL